MPRSVAATRIDPSEHSPTAKRIDLPVPPELNVVDVMLSTSKNQCRNITIQPRRDTFVKRSTSKPCTGSLLYGHGIVVQCIADCPCATGGTRSHAQGLVADHRAARCHARPEPQRVLLSRHQSAEVFHRDGDYRAFVELIDGPRNGPRRRNGSGRRKLKTANNILEFFDAADKLILPPLPQFFQLFQILFF